MIASPAGTDLPLAGVKVLELAHVLAGPAAGALLADLGADVVKVEVTHGDTFRASPAMFGMVNHNKRDIAVDLKTPAGNAAVRRLADQVDILVENMGPGVTERLGLSYDQIRATNPGIIYLALKGFLPGPLAHRPLFDEVAQMMGGLSYMTGPSGRPLRAGASVVDIGAAAYGVVGVLAALHQRATTGEGQMITAGLYETVAYWVGQHMAEAATTGEPSTPMSEVSQATRLRWGVYDLFQTKDGDVFIAITSDAQWARFCEGFGIDDSADERLQSNESRLESRAWLVPWLREKIATHTTVELEDLLERCSVPYGAMRRPDQLFGDPQLEGADQFFHIPVPDLGDVTLPKPPINSTAYRMSVRKPPPTLGEHSVEILEELGYDQDQIQSMLDENAITR